MPKTRESKKPNPREKIHHSESIGQNVLEVHESRKLV